MTFQYFIVLAVVIAVIVWQYYSFSSNEKRIKRIKALFPEHDDSLIIKDDDTLTIYNETAKEEFKETIDDLNSYISENKNKTLDYHILKEIVDRNSKSLEDEVETMLSTPLYLGLIATIFGIAFGVVAFAWKDLANLLSGTDLNPEGIQILLTDVGFAMAASLCGVAFTKFSTSHFNDAKTVMAKNKNRFLTWIQTDLMSKMSDDIIGAIIKMTHDLNEFNSSFAQNTQDLKRTLKTVKDNYGQQVKLLEAIDNLEINKIAKANIDVYTRLQGCTEELENLFRILKDSETYIARVTQLNENLGNIEQRTKVFEELGNYFMQEVEFVKDRQGVMRQQMSSLDSVLQDALSNLGGNVTQSLIELSSVFQLQNQRIQQLIEEQQQSLADSLINQQEAINEKIGKIENPFEGINDIFADGLRSIKHTFDEQNAAIGELMSKQTQVFEEALKAQQKVLLEKLQDAPNQMQVLSDVHSSIEQLQQCITELKQQKPQITITSTPEMDVEIPVQPKQGKWISYFVPICALGSFLVLLGLLVLRLLGI